VTVVLVDALDSFVHVIDQYVQVLGHETLVVRSGPGVGDLVDAVRPRALVLGPGPGRPEASGHPELVRRFAGRLPLLGVCLGHQAIAVALGGSVVRAAAPRHGDTSTLRHDGRGVFTGAAPGTTVTRYHSLVVREDDLPGDLVVTAVAEDDGAVMGLRHRTLPVEGVQFHPESVLTEGGLAMLRSFFTVHVHAAAAGAGPGAAPAVRGDGEPS